MVRVKIKALDVKPGDVLISRDITDTVIAIGHQPNDELLILLLRTQGSNPTIMTKLKVTRSHKTNIQAEKIFRKGSRYNG